MTWIQGPKDLKGIHAKPLFTGKTAVASHSKDSTWLLGLTFTMEGEDRCFLFKKMTRERRVGETEKRGVTHQSGRGAVALQGSPVP